MSLDRSLKSASSLVRHRNVLTRDERLLRLAEQEKWDESKPVLGLPKVANRKLEVGGKGGKDDKEADAAAGAAAPAAPAASTAGAKATATPAAKGAAPAAKAAAPAKGGKK